MNLIFLSATWRNYSSSDCGFSYFFRSNGTPCTTLLPARQLGINLFILQLYSFSAEKNLMMKSTLCIDINCDMGESYGNFKIGNDELIFPFITSCNIACGFHGGDPFHIEKTIRQALTYGVSIGAHPSFPDLAGFGRRLMKIKFEELRALIKYQIAALKGMSESLGGKLHYVKPHGALYNLAADDERTASAILEATAEIDDGLMILGLAGSTMEKLAGEKQLLFAAEAFADRRYTPEGRLVSRSQPGAVIESPDEAAAQVLSIVHHQKVISVTGLPVTIKADSLCIHGDNPAAVSILQSIDAVLRQHHIEKKSFVG